MHKLQNRILSAANSHLSLQLAFEKLKNNYIGWSSQMHLHSDQALNPNLKNKALYLDYIEQVLKNKELDMIKLQHQLTLKENRIYEEQYRRGIGQSLAAMEEIRIMERKLKNIQDRMGIRDEQYLDLYRRFQQESTNSKNQMQQAFKKQYTDLINQRRTLRSKLTQFNELQSYEKYLNELHNALELKSQQLAQRQSFLSQQNTLNNGQEDHAEQYDTNKQTIQSNTSNRKRIKIFNTKPHHQPSEESQVFSNQNQNAQQHQNSNNKNAQKIQYEHNQTFANVESNNYASHHKSIPNYNANPYVRQPLMKFRSNANADDSSAILAENSQDDVGYFDRTGPIKEENYNSNQLFHKEQKCDTFKCSRTADSSVQVDSQSFTQAGQRLRKQGILLKFAKKWLKYSFEQNSTLNKKKILAVNLWRMNTKYDEKLSKSAVRSLQILQKVWKKKQKMLYMTKMFPYNELSLKRKKYAELMFDMEQKITHRVHTQNVLKSILTHRHRKQRLIFYLYFCRFVKNCYNQEKISKAIKDKQKLGYTLNTAHTVIAQVHQGSAVNSQLLNQNKIHALAQKSANSLIPNSSVVSSSINRSQPMSKSPSTSKMGKQNQQEIKRMETELQKVRQEMAQKQRIQKLLATQCVKLEGLIKLTMIMNQAVFKTNNYAMNRIKQMEYSDKINSLTTQLNGLEFKFDLALTKCKLGLANSSNKLTTLENLLQFTHLIK